jgi:hypothetical protein
LRHDRAETLRVATELDITSTTIYRWINGVSVPHINHLKRLLEVMLPEHRSNLIYAIKQSFPNMADLYPKSTREVPKDIYYHVVEMVVQIEEDSMRQWQVIQAIFEYILLHLDADRLGLSITYSTLMPAHKDGIHSLREVMVLGNYPFPTSSESKVYLGSTTLVGTTAQVLHTQTWESSEHRIGSLAQVNENAHSACAHMVMRAGRLSGVLSVSSTQPNFFNDPKMRQAVVEYAQLLSLGLCERDFYPHQQLALRPMPDLKWQREEIARTYVNRVIKCASTYNLSRQEAEKRVIQEMELEFEIRGQLSTEQQHATM